MHSVIVSYLLVWKPLAYALIFLGVALEGDLTLYTVSLLSFQGIINYKFLLIVVFFAVLLGDLFFYWLGRKACYFPERMQRWFGNVSSPVDHHLRKRPFKTLFLCKFVYGLHHATLIRSGCLQIPLKTFLKINILSSLLWITIISLLAYFTQASFELVKEYIRTVEVALFAGMLLFFLLWYAISLIIRKEL